MTFSFYGGRQGKNFEITKVFNNRFELETDLEKGYNSTVGVGDLVYISYGLPNQTEYNINKNYDLLHYNNKTYNGTLWEKIYGTETNNNIPTVGAPEQQLPIENVTVYDEAASLTTDTTLYQINNPNTGLGYRLIASLTGNTPQFIVEATTLPPMATPQVLIDNNQIDTPTLQFNLPRAIKFFNGNGYKVLPTGSSDDNSVLCYRSDPSKTYSYSEQELERIKDNNLFDSNGKFLMEPGDKYIDSKTGNIYYYIGIVDEKHTFVYQARIDQEISGVAIQTIDSFDVQGEWNKPSVMANYKDDTEKIEQTFTFNFPKMPKLSVEATQGEDAAVTGTPSANGSEYKLSFTLPKGPTGDPIKIIAEMPIYATDLQEAGVTTLLEYLYKIFNNDSAIWDDKDFASGKSIISITYIETYTENEEVIELKTSYWLSANPLIANSNAQKGLILMRLTGNVSNFLVGLQNNGALQDATEDQGYHVAAINTLIENIETKLTQLIWGSF